MRRSPWSRSLQGAFLRHLPVVADGNVVGVTARGDLRGPEHFHGAALQPKPTDMAFPHRHPGYSVLFIDPKDNRANNTWAKETFAALVPFTRHGAYSNYMADDDLLSGVKRALAESSAAAGATTDRALA
jgi:hypothetical protein